MPDRLLQNHYSVAPLQHRVLYNVVVIPSTHELSLAAMAQVLSTTDVQVRQIQILPPGILLPTLLVIVLVIAGIVWAHRRSRHASSVADRPDQWPPRQPERRPQDDKGGSPWQ